MVVAWWTVQPWLMSIMMSTSSPTASRRTRMRSTSAAAEDSAPQRSFIARNP